MDKEIFISVCLPVLNGEKTIYQTLNSILSQNYKNFEIVISNNCSTDNTVKIIKSFNDSRIKLFNTESFLTCGENIINTISKSSYEFLVFVCADDLFDREYLKKINNIYKSNNIVAILRNYLWFNDNEVKPNRLRFEIQKDKILNLSHKKKLLKSDYETILSIDQLSGISLKKKFLSYSELNKFSFIETASLLLPILVKYNFYVIGYPYIAIRIHENNGASNPKSFANSPINMWYLVFDKYFNSSKRYIFNNTFGRSYESLIQIRIYSNFKYLLREIFNFIKFNKFSIFNAKFYFYILICLLPKKIIYLIKEKYKKIKKNNYKDFKNMKLNF